MEIEIFSSNVQPYGLLSNNALIPIKVDDQQYSSVTEYVYVNLFTSAEFRDKMKHRYMRDPYENAIALRNEEDEKIYYDALVFGTGLRFKQDRDLLERLKSTKDQPIKVMTDDKNANRKLHILFDKLRLGSKDFFDDKYGLVPFEQVNAVVVGVANKLISNPDFPSAPYPELVKYAVKNTGIRNDLMGDLENLDEIVPYLKIKLKDLIYEDQVSRFKPHLLDVTLDYILRTKYPHIQPEQYSLAKRQQLAKMSRLVHGEEDRLYDLYLSGGIPPEITNNLRMKLTAPVSNIVTVETLESVESSDNPFSITQNIMKRSNLGLVQPFLINEQTNSYFLPSYPGQVTVQDVTYKSVIAFAYHKLFSNIGMQVDVNAYNIDQLAGMYGYNKIERIASTLTANNEKATSIKFTNDSLKALLMATKGRKLIWADMSDQVLGVGGQMRPNRAGTYLEYLRDHQLQIPSVEISHFMDNVVFSTWFESRVDDYANTLKLFSTKSLDLLKIVYGRKSAPIKSISPAVSAVMHRRGLVPADQNIVLPMIVEEFHDLVWPNSNLLAAVTKLVNSYHMSRPSETDRKVAENNLNNIYGQIKQYLIQPIDANKFARSILSNQPTTSHVQQEQWWRINYWKRWNATKQVRFR